MDFSSPEMQGVLAKIAELNNTVVNQSLLLQTLINLLKSKNTLPLVKDEDIINEFVKVRDTFIKQQEAANKIIMPNKDIVVAETQVKQEETK